MDSFAEVYALLKSTGLLYGISQDIPPFIIKEVPLSEDEKAKINLIPTPYFTYTLKNKEPYFKTLLGSIFMCYKELGMSHISEYAQGLGHITINTTYYTINSYDKNKRDEKPVLPFTASSPPIESTKQEFDGPCRYLLTNKYSASENWYFIDVACITVYEDQSLGYTKSDFIFGLGRGLGLFQINTVKPLKDVTVF